MNITQTPLEGVIIIEPRVFEDQRGFFMETYQQKRYAECGIRHRFVQDNLSCSTKGVLRGLHYQLNHPQAKLIQIIQGEAFDVVVDIRKGSPTFGRYTSVTLSGENKRRLFIPEGFAHGFCVLSDTVMLQYKCSDYYAPDDEHGILFSDPDIGIPWPVTDPVLSAKDRNGPFLRDISPERLPIYTPAAR